MVYGSYTNQLAKARISILLDHTPAIDYSHLSIGIQAGEMGCPAAQLGRHLIGRKHSRHDCSVLESSFQNHSMDLQACKVPIPW